MSFEKQNEESITAPIVEKQRSNKNRNVAKLDQTTTLSQRYGPYFIKTSFLLDRCETDNKPSHEELKLYRSYDELAKKYSEIDWQVNESALDACHMSSEEKKKVSCREKNASHCCWSNAVGCDAAKPIQSRELFFEPELVQQRRRKRVLVPISGGISSLATLWWCLQQDFDVYLCYAFDALSCDAETRENSLEIQCLLRLLQYIRCKDGTLLFSTTEKDGNIHQLSKSEIHERIKIVQVPLASYYLKKRESLMKSEYSLKAHPQAYLIFYRHILMVAQSLNCSAIAFGLYDDAKKLFQDACPMFASVYRHELLFPFASRVESSALFFNAAEQSWNVWKSFSLENKNSIWQTAGPSLMPNLAHYVTTCETRPQTALEQKMLQAEEKALAQVQELIDSEEQEFEDTCTKSKKKRATDPYQHAQYLTIFMKQLEKMQDLESEQIVSFNFCNQKTCLHCYQWKQTLPKKRKNTDYRWQNLASEYCARLQANFNRKTPAATNIIVKSASKKRELTLADLAPTNRNKKPRIDENAEEEEEEELDEIFDNEDQENDHVHQDEDEAAIINDDEAEGEVEEEEAEKEKEDDEEENEEENEDDDDDDDEDDDNEDEDDDDDDDGDEGGDEDY